MSTTFETELISKLKTKKLSDTSIKSYIRNLELLNDKKPLNNIKFLNDIDTIQDKLNNKSANTAKSYYIIIVSILNLLDNDKLRDKYYKLMKDKVEETKKNLEDGKANKAQTNNWETWTDVLKKYKDIKDIVDTFKNNKNINENQYNCLLALMILALYTLTPPRRNEYANMNVIYKADNNDNINYLSYSDKYFYFNDYKTKKTYGSQIIPINKDLMEIINLYLKYHPVIKGKINKNTNSHFLVDWEGKNITTNNITKILNKIFDKKISTSMLRHIYLTSKYKDVNKEEKKDADLMAHSQMMQKEYIKNL